MKPKMVGRKEGGVPPDASIHSRAGLAHGTIVLTLDGEIPVEYLSPGDRIITRDVGMARLVRVAARLSRRPLYRIAPRSLGAGRPETELLVVAGQKILLRDWRAKVLFGQDQALVPVERLADGEFVARTPAGDPPRIYDLRFDMPQVIYANGVETLCPAAEPVPA